MTTRHSPWCTGSIAATGSAPFFSGKCEDVACPADSTGDSVAAGCRCNAGFSGVIKARAWAVQEPLAGLGALELLERSCQNCSDPLAMRMPHAGESCQVASEASQ